MVISSLEWHSHGHAAEAVAIITTQFPAKIQAMGSVVRCQEMV